VKQVTSADSLITISHYRNILLSEGIRSFIRNEHLGSIIGEMPFQEAWPQLWVENDLDYDRAVQLIDASRIIDDSPAAAWRCKSCDAENEGQFAVCWQCGVASDQELTPGGPANA
jgi:Putative prokaryotic signal transducing protein